MQNVTNAWKSIMSQSFTNEEDIEITISNVDTTLESGATITTNGATAKTDLTLLKNMDLSAGVNSWGRLATMEFNKWSPMDLPINGQNFDVSTTYESNFVPSSVSPATITAQWSSVQTNSIDGITVFFSTLWDEWATAFTVTAYNGTSVIETETVTNNKDIKCFVQFANSITNFNKIVISITSWCVPNSRAKVERLFFGSLIMLNKNDIVKATFKQSFDPVSLELPQNTMSLQIDNSLHRWESEETTGYYSILKNNIKVVVRFGLYTGSVWEWINGGVYYLSSWKTPQSEDIVYLEGTDILNMLLTKQFDFSLFSSGSFPAQNIINACFTQCGITSGWSTNVSRSITVDSTLFNSPSCAEMLQYVANACAAEMIIARDGTISINRTPTSFSATDYEISRDVCYQDVDISLSQKVRNVVVNNQLYRLHSDGAIDQTLDNALVVGISHELFYLTWVGNYIGERTEYNGSFRCDMRLDAGDIVHIEKRNGVKEWARVWNIEYSFNGGFEATFNADKKAVT